MTTVKSPRERAISDMLANIRTHIPDFDMASEIMLLVKAGEAALQAPEKACPTKALAIAIKALTTLARNNISDDIAPTALREIGYAVDEQQPHPSPDIDVLKREVRAAAETWDGEELVDWLHERNLITTGRGEELVIGALKQDKCKELGYSEKEESFFIAGYNSAIDDALAQLRKVGG